MKVRFLIPILASAALAGPALAQDAAATPPGNAFMLKHHAEMCNNLYAHAVGKLAALEIELKLTASQKPLYERWRSVKLNHAKDHADKCATMTMPNRDMSIMDGLKLETAMLEARLADLKAQAPALQALVDSLNPDQQAIFKRAAVHAMHERAGHFMGGHFMGERGMHRPMMDGGMVMPPPPPPAQ